MNPVSKPTSYESIYAAIQHDDVAGVKAWLEHDSSLLDAPKKRKRNGITDVINGTPLHYAAYHQSDSVLALLLSLGADIHTLDGSGNAPFYLSASRGDSPSFQRFCEHIKTQVSEGVLEDYQFKNRQGRSVFHMAVFWGDEKVVKALLPLYETALYDTDKASPLWIAARMNRLPTLELFLSYPHFKAPLSQALKDDALLLAASCNHLEGTKLLLDYGADPHVRNPHGLKQNLLGFALQHGGNMMPLFNFLLSCGLDIHDTAANGCTLLHQAVNQNPQAIPFLLEKGLDIDAQTNLGETPLHRAVSRADISTIQTLLQAGANPHLTMQEEHLELGRGQLTAFCLLGKQRILSSVPLMKMLVEHNTHPEGLEESLFLAMDIFRQHPDRQTFHYLQGIHLAVSEQRTLHSTLTEPEDPSESALNRKTSKARSL